MVKEKYHIEPKKCLFCKKIISFERKEYNFCNRSCSMLYIHKFRPEIKKQVSKKLKGRKSTRIFKKLNLKCKYCKKFFEILPCHKKRKFCSRLCADKGTSKINMGGYREGYGRSKYGWYKGIFCGSSYELAWIIYHIDHNIPFERNKEGFEYEFNGKKHKYYPDFICSEIYYELKGYKTEKDDFKWKCFPHKLKILFQKDLKIIFDYVIEKYGKNFINLYDK